MARYKRMRTALNRISIQPPLPDSILSSDDAYLREAEWVKDELIALAIETDALENSGANFTKEEVAALVRRITAWEKRRDIHFRETERRLIALRVKHGLSARQE